MRRVTVRAPARLHLGFLDLHGGLGRRFGGLGLSIDAFATVVHAHRAPELLVEGREAARATVQAEDILEGLGIRSAAHLSIAQTAPAHVGLGSGTQLSLCIAAALARLYDIDCPPRQLALLAERGRRSGIGVGAFSEGGFLVDGGRTVQGGVPQVIARAPFPTSWRILLIFDESAEGLHGVAEAEAFAALAPLSAEQTGALCRLALIQVLPALLDEDLGSFGSAIGEIQRVVGDHFAPAQGGRFTSAPVARVLAWLESAGVAGVGQSSWGPTGFAILASERLASELLAAARSEFASEPGLRFVVCGGRNSGASIESVDVDSLAELI
jgi:beta-ribofuranosylaminobenzene 5'-phosphate synthase